MRGQLKSIRQVIEGTLHTNSKHPPMPIYKSFGMQYGVCMEPVWRVLDGQYGGCLEVFQLD